MTEAARTPWASVAVVFIVVGAALRAVSFLSHGQLYGDEAGVALNVLNRSFAALARPLDFGQAAPTPFLWVEKLLTRAGGVTEHALRLVPLIAGVCSLGLLWAVARRLAGEEPALFATLLAACSTLLIGYAVEVKQYSTDVLITLVLLWLALDALRAEGGPGAWRRLAVGGVVALWASQPAVFVLVGVGLALLTEPRLRADPSWPRRCAATIAAWMGVFCTLYFLSYRVGVHDAYLQDVWESWFLFPGTPNFGHRVARAVRAAIATPLVGDVPYAWHAGPSLLAHAGPWVLGTMCAGAFLGGLAWIIRHRGLPIGLLLSAPYVAVFGAATIGAYPPAPRLLLFLAPFLFIVCGCALWAVARLAPPPARRLACAVLLLLLIGWRFPPALDSARQPERDRDTASLVAAIEERPPGTPVYVLVPSSGCHCSAWVLYTTNWSAPDTARIWWFARARPAARTSESAQLLAIHGRYRDLLGRSARMQYGDGRWQPATPDSAWAAGESERIRLAANPRAWVWVADWYPESAVAVLLHGIRQRGGRLISARRGTGAAAWEVEFAAPDGRAGVLTPPRPREPRAFPSHTHPM